VKPAQLAVVGSSALLFLSAVAACGGSEAETFADPNASRGPYSLVFTGSADDESSSHMHAASANTWKPRKLAGAFDDIARPVWSPSFQHVLDPSGVVVRADGGFRFQLPNNTAIGDAFPWSPDGQMLVYASDPYEEGRIFVVPLLGSEPREIGTGALPTWAADGRVYFRRGSTVRATDPVSGLGTDVTIAESDARAMLQWGEWSPDGTRVAYDVGGEGARSVFVRRMQADEDPRELLTDVDPPIVDVHAYTWSPDGEHLAVVAGRDDPSAESLGPGTNGIRWGLHIVDVDDSGSDEVLDIEAHELTWSPNGEWIALERFWGYDAERVPAADIWLVRPDGTGLRRITNGRRPGTDWNHTTGTDYANAAWVPEAVVAEALAKR